MTITNLSKSDLIRNMETAAERLTGRAVSIRINALPSPPGLKAYGIAQRDRSGLAVIDLDPAAFEDIKTFAETFTHELAHIVKHFDGLPRRDINQGIAREIAKQALHLSSLARLNPIVKKQEDEADALAAQWMAIVNRHYGGYELSERDPVLSVLKILYHEAGRQ